ncbi:copper resistance protein B [Accumulibacter sp.]|uniref:copper resistance protein B n=1 Tax=Accumulibacter sp. TaxID=2053492 RepID=UPI00260ACE2F|nr:copper resistance protein B [Accumulibacter sp.]
MFAALTARALSTALLALASLAAQAQNDHAAHAQTDPRPAAPAAAPKTDAADAQAAPAASASDAAAPPAMDHGDMRMPGGPPPADARDPHAYANGQQLGAGDYAVPGVPRLTLADEHFFASLRAETFERRFTRNGDDSTAYDLQGWVGTTFDRAVVKAEGDIGRGKLEDARTELLWGHAIAPYWDTQLGVRLDSGEGPGRQWLAFGVQGLAPYWFEVEATAYVGSAGRSALLLKASYELLLTQRLILEPRTELQFFGKDDPERGIGRGLAEASVGLRLRYEFSRQFAPYIGVERAGSFGETARQLRAEGDRTQQTRWLAGLRFWF